MLRLMLREMVMSKWQSIETAPRDGSVLWLYQREGSPHMYEGWWHKDLLDGTEYWQDDADSEPNPTHWMPLPDPPQLDSTPQSDNVTD